MGFELNNKQKEAVLKSISWYYTKSHEQQLWLLLAGAGAGKTTTISYIVRALGISSSSVLFCSLTGKACVVNRLKGNMSQTIHKSFYNAKVYKNNVYFTKKPTIPSFIKLIVIDEFGMVGDSIIEDILSFGVPVIGIGDPGQIQPLFEKNTYIKEESADAYLTEVMRTNSKSGILDIASIYRNKQIPKIGCYGDSNVFEYKEEIKPLVEYSKILVWRNKTRKLINKMIRDDLNITEKYPIKGEKVVFLANRYDKSIPYIGIDINIMNGLESIVLEDYKIVNDNQIQLKLRPYFMEDSSEFFDVLCNRRIFDSYHEDTPELKLIMQTDRELDYNSIFVDFAYATTINSSQGSEYSDVLVLDEVPKFRPEYFNLLYTAVTRAQKRVDVLLDQ